MTQWELCYAIEKLLGARGDRHGPPLLPDASFPLELLRRAVIEQPDKEVRELLGLLRVLRTIARKFGDPEYIRLDNPDLRERARTDVGEALTALTDLRGRLKQELDRSTVRLSRPRPPRLRVPLLKAPARR